jgi:MFS family permease
VRCANNDNRSVLGSSGVIAGIAEPTVAAFFRSESDSVRSVAKGVLVASILAGGLLGSFLGPPIAHHRGRRQALIAAGIICIVFALLLAFSPHFAMLVVCRLLLGLSLGIATTVAPLFVAEMAHAESSGRVCTLFQASSAYPTDCC